MKSTLIYNPRAGQGSGRRQVQAAARYLVDQGWRVTLHETAGPGDVARHARAAVAAADDVVIIVGGDGTVNGAANILAGTDVALGVLPMGTGNVLAAELGLVGVPTMLHRPDPVAAARQLCRGSVRPVDLGRVEARTADGADVTRYFVLWAGVGFDAAITQTVETELRQGKRLLGPWSFLIAGIDAALRYRGTWATVRFNATERRVRIMLVGVANIQLYAGTVRIAPEARLDDGWLDAYIFEGHGLWRLLSHAVGLVLRRYRRDPRLDTRAVQRLVVETAEPLPVHVDGEPIGTTPLSLEVEPHALKLLVPAEAPARLFSEE
jgi:diacylglycerol kinase (ATP)